MQHLLRIEPPWRDSDEPDRIRKSNLYGAIAFVTLLLLGGLVLFGEPLTVVEQAHFERSDISFDSRSLHNSPVELSKVSKGDPSALRLSFEFKPYTINAADNLMQTGASNKGLRIELSAPGVLAVIVGYAGTLGYGVYSVSSTVEPGIWHRLEISISRRKRITVRYDNRTVADATDAFLGYDVSDVTFGTGFNKSRPFDGVIANGSFDYSTFRLVPGAERAVLYCELALLLLSVIFIFLGSNARLFEPHEAG